MTMTPCYATCVSSISKSIATPTPPSLWPSTSLSREWADGLFATQPRVLTGFRTVLQLVLSFTTTSRDLASKWLTVEKCHRLAPTPTIRYFPEPTATMVSSSPKSSLVGFTTLSLILLIFVVLGGSLILCGRSRRFVPIHENQSPQGRKGCPDTFHSGSQTIVDHGDVDNDTVFTLASTAKFTDKVKADTLSFGLRGLAFFFRIVSLDKLLDIAEPNSGGRKAKHIEQLRFLDKKLRQAFDTNANTTRVPGGTLAAAFSSGHVDPFRLPCADNFPSTSTRTQPVAPLARPPCCMCCDVFPYSKKISEEKNASQHTQQVEERARRAVEKARLKATTLAEEPSSDPKDCVDPQAVRKRTADLLIELRKEHDEITARIRASLNKRREGRKTMVKKEPDGLHVMPPESALPQPATNHGCPAEIKIEHKNLSVVDEDANWSVSAYVPPAAQTDVSHAEHEPQPGPLPHLTEDIFYSAPRRPNTPLNFLEGEKLAGFGFGSPSRRRIQRIDPRDIFVTSTPRVNHANFGGFCTSTPRRDVDPRKDTWVDFF